MQAARAAAAPAAKKTEAQTQASNDEDLNPAQYYERRVQGIRNARANQVNPYPHKFETSIEVPAFVASYKDVADGQHDESTVESVAGLLLAFCHPIHNGPPRMRWLSDLFPICGETRLE